jgi:hypothetical protein
MGKKEAVSKVDTNSVTTKVARMSAGPPRMSMRQKGGANKLQEETKTTADSS